MFKLAPMTTDLRLMTWGLLVLPLILLCAALAAPPLAGIVLFPTAAFVLALFALTWLGFRPNRFELDERTLRIVWPVRSRMVERTDIVSARVVSSADFRREYGLGMRIGVGGLWGGFGFLKTARETFSMWISRTDRYVLVQLRNDKPLLITPEDPERFVASLA